MTGICKAGPYPVLRHQKIAMKKPALLKTLSTKCEFQEKQRVQPAISSLGSGAGRLYSHLGPGEQDWVTVVGVGMEEAGGGEMGGAFSGMVGC